MHRRARQLLVAVAILLAQRSIWPYSLHAEQADSSRRSIDLAGTRVQLTALEAELFSIAESGEADRDWLLKAALVAGGNTDPDALDRCRLTVEQWVNHLCGSGAAVADPRHRAQLVFDFLHDRVCYGRYRVECSDPADTLDTGDFNCVSSAILYNCLTEAVGLSAIAAETPGHAHSVLLLPGGRLKVETTCARWFQIMDDPVASRRMLARATAHAGSEIDAPESAAGDAGRELSMPGLVALVYYNRGVDLLERGQFKKAVSVNAKAWRLDPLSHTIKGNLLASLNNWALDLGDHGHFELAAKVLDNGRLLAPEHRPFTVNSVAVYRRWIDRLCDRGSYARASAVAARALEKMPGENRLADLRIAVYSAWSMDLADRGRLSDALRLLADARRRYPGRDELLEAEAAAVSHLRPRLLSETR